MILVLIFISNIDDRLLSNKENNIPEESLTERYVARRINVSNSMKRNLIERIK